MTAAELALVHVHPLTLKLQFKLSLIESTGVRAHKKKPHINLSAHQTWIQMMIISLHTTAALISIL